MTLAENYLNINEAVNEFDEIAFKCTAFIEAAESEHKVNCMNAEIKVMEESGTYEDYMYLEEASEESFITKCKNAIKKLWESFVATVKRIASSIASLFKGKDLKKAEEAAKKTKAKVKVPDYKAIEKADDEYESFLDKQMAKVKAGKNVNEEELKAAKEAHDKKVKKALAATIAVPAAVAVGILADKKAKNNYEKNSKRDINIDGMDVIFPEFQEKDNNFKNRWSQIFKLNKAKFDCKIERMKTDNAVISKIVNFFHKNIKKDGDINKGPTIIDGTYREINASSDYEPIDLLDEIIEESEDSIFANNYLEMLESELGILPPEFDD